MKNCKLRLFPFHILTLHLLTVMKNADTCNYLCFTHITCCLFKYNSVVMRNLCFLEKASRLQLLHNSKNLTDNCSAALNKGFLQQQAEGPEHRNFPFLTKLIADVQRVLYSLLRTTSLPNTCVSSVNTQNTRKKFNTPREKVVDCRWVLTLALKG